MEANYYNHQAARIDGRGKFVECTDGLIHRFGKMTLTFLQYDLTTNKKTLSVDIFLSNSEFLALAEEVSSRALLAKTLDAKKRGEEHALLYSAMSGYNREKAAARAKDLPFPLPPGKSVSKQFRITPGRKSDFLLTAGLTLARDSDKGIQIPDPGPLKAYIQIPVSQSQLAGLTESGKAKIYAYETVKMFLHREEYGL